MTPRTEDRSPAKPSVLRLSSDDLRATLGPAEAQYAETVVLAPENAGLACGGTVVNDGPFDESPGAGFMAFTLAWNDLANETGYRLQLDQNSATYVTEDTPYFHNPDILARTVLFIAPGTDTYMTFRLMAHVGHDPGSHDDIPVAGDVLSNTCTILLEVPDEA